MVDSLHLLVSIFLSLLFPTAASQGINQITCNPVRPLSRLSQLKRRITDSKSVNPHRKRIVYIYFQYVSIRIIVGGVPAWSIPSDGDATVSIAEAASGIEIETVTHLHVCACEFTVILIGCYLIQSCLQNIEVCVCANHALFSLYVLIS